MESALLTLDSQPGHRESIQQLLRDLHTLKGASASIGLSTLADYIHRLEDRLQSDSQEHPAIFEELLSLVDQVRSELNVPESGKCEGDGCVDQRSTTPASSPAQTAAIVASQTPLLPVADGTDAEMVRVKATQLNRLMDMLAELVALKNDRESEISELRSIHQELISSVTKMRLIRSETPANQTKRTSLQLSEVANDVLEAAQSLKDSIRPFAESNLSVADFIGQFRQELVQLRRTPISGLFQRLHRVARDAARAEGKKVNLELKGQHAGIERTLQQNLYEPLLHVIRNAICHGIEDPATRKENGKSEDGKITLNAKSGPELFVIEISDDGRGLDYEAIRRRAIERGLLAKEQAASRAELSRMIFQPGFSTRDTADELAGRGVGMDVVAATLKRMRGWLDVQSTPGKGTTVRLSFPLPSVIQNAMVLRCGKEIVAVPMESVQNAGRVKNDVRRAHLGDLLGWPGESQVSEQVGITVRGGKDSHGPSFGMMVDEIVGPEELVIRPLPRLLRNHPYCAGVTLSSKGRSMLLLDVRRLLETREHSKETEIADGHYAATESTAPKILVVDDSLSARKRVVRSLERYRVNVEEVNNGRDALSRIQNGDYDVVFSDMEMPLLSGMELLEELQREEIPNKPSVVIVSSRCEREFTSRARSLGAFDYLAKPLQDHALDAVLTRIGCLEQLEGCQ
ncbi:MAG: response regulator, partial [Planctomycetota bacterium]